VIACTDNSFGIFDATILLLRNNSISNNNEAG